MKIKFLITGVLSLATVTTFAQKGELSTAADQYKNYEALRGGNLTKPTALSVNSLKSAKTAIDKAAAHEKTSPMAQTWALKGAIYSSLAVADSVPSTSMPLYTTADESLKKAKELDTKGEYKNMITESYRLLGSYMRNKGVKEYNNKQMEQAFQSFDAFRQIMPEDTDAVYLTGIIAANINNWDAAISNYQKLVTMNYSKKAEAYQQLSGFYLSKKDTANAAKTLSEAAAKFPNNAAISKSLLEMNLQMGKQDEVIKNIQSAIANDPKNKVLYYYGGMTHSQLADAAGKKAQKEKVPATLATLQKNREENLNKAAEMYKKALEIDPNYFEATLNLGYVLITPAIDTYNAANKLPVSKKKEYDAAMAKAGVQFDAAKPYLLKAVELNPKSPDALTNLKSYYIAKNDMANANKIKAQLDALK